MFHTTLNCLICFLVGQIIYSLYTYFVPPLFNTDHWRLMKIVSINSWKENQSLLIHSLTQTIQKYVTDLIMANYKMNQ